MTEAARSGHSSSGLLAPLTPQAPLSIEALYEAHFADVWRVLRRLGLRPPGIDDAVQDVFLVAHRKLAAFEGRSTLKTWLVGICLRVAKDHRRSAARKSRLEPLPEELPDARGHTPLEHAERAQAARFLDTFLETFDLEKRTVFVFAELEGLTAPGIASLTGAGVNTVYSRLRVARERFEAALRAREPEVRR